MSAGSPAREPSAEAEWELLTLRVLAMTDEPAAEFITQHRGSPSEAP